MDAAGKRGKAPTIAPAANLPTVDSTHIIIDTTEQKEQPPSADNDDEAADGSSGDAADSPSTANRPVTAAVLGPSGPTVPLLEAYHAYDHPRPLWLFFLGGQFQYELSSANPPKMLKLVQACLSGERLSAEDLQGMELQTDSAEVAAEKRRKRLQKKKEEEEAKRKAKELEEAQQAKKKREIIRTTPEYTIHLSLAQYTNQTAEGAAADFSSTAKQPLLVLYWKDGESDYYYHSQTVRAVPSADGNVVFPTSLYFKKAETAEAESHIELRVCLYEAADDEPVKGEREDQGLLGEGYVQLSALTGGQTEVRIVHRDLTVPPLSPTAKSPRGVKLDKLMALANIKVKERVSEGTLSDFRFTVSINGLAAPSAPADAATPANAYTVQLHAMDDTTPVYTLLATTEPTTTLPLTFTTPLPATHYSNVPRQLRFQLHSDDGAAINVAECGLDALAKRAGGELVLSAVDAAGGVSSVEFVVHVDEVDEDGNVIAPAAAAMSDEELARQAALQWLQLTFTADGLNPASFTQSAVVAVYQEDGTGAMSLLHTTEPLPAAAALNWQYTTFVPRDEVVKRKYKAVLVDASNASAVTGAPVVGQHVFDLAWLPPQAEQPTVQHSTDLPLETSEGLPLEGDCKLHIAAQSVGQLHKTNLSFAVSGLELAEGDAPVNGILAVYSTLGGAKQLVGKTERVVGATGSPLTFATALNVSGYTDVASPLQLCVYNASADDSLLDTELVAECTFTADQVRYMDSNAVTLPLTLTTILKQVESSITVTNNAATERPNAPEQQSEATASAEAAADPTTAQSDQAQQQPAEAAPAAEPAVAEQPVTEQTTEERSTPVVAVEVNSQPAVDDGMLHSLVFTFDAKDVKGTEGELTLTLYGIDSVTGSEVELGSTYGTPADERVSFIAPITLLAFSAAHRQLRVLLATGDNVFGEATVAAEALSQARSTANKFPLIKAGESTGATISIRVNAHADDPRPVSVPPTPIADKSARTLSPRPPASPAASTARPPLSPSATVFKAPASPSTKPAASPSTRTTPRIASKTPSAQTTPKVTPRAGAAAAAAAAEGSRKPSVSLSRKPSVSKKEEAEQKATASEHSRQASRSVTKKSPVVSARKEAQPASAAHSRQTSRSVSKKGEADAAPAEAAAAPEPESVAEAAATLAAAAEATETKQEAAAEAAPRAEPEAKPEVKAESAVTPAATEFSEAEPETAAETAPSTELEAKPEDETKPAAETATKSAAPSHSEPDTATEVAAKTPATAHVEPAPTEAAAESTTSAHVEKAAAESAQPAQPAEQHPTPPAGEEHKPAQTQHAEAEKPAEQQQPVEQPAEPEAAPATQTEAHTHAAAASVAEPEAADDEYADDTHAESTEDDATIKSDAAVEAATAIDTHPQLSDDDYKDDTEPTAADETIPGSDVHVPSEASEHAPQAQPVAAEEKAEGAQPNAVSAVADVVASNQGEGKQETSVAASEDEYADDTEAEAAAE